MREKWVGRLSVSAMTHTPASALPPLTTTPPMLAASIWTESTEAAFWEPTWEHATPKPPTRTPAIARRPKARFVSGAVICSLLRIIRNRINPLDDLPLAHVEHTGDGDLVPLAVLAGDVVVPEVGNKGAPGERLEDLELDLRRGHALLQALFDGDPPFDRLLGLQEAHDAVIGQEARNLGGVAGRPRCRKIVDDFDVRLLGGGQIAGERRLRGAKGRESPYSNSTRGEESASCLGHGHPSLVFCRCSSSAAYGVPGG